MVGAAAKSVLFLVDACNRRPQLGDTAGRRVMGVAVLHGLEGGTANVLGGREIGLPQTEIEDRNPLGFQLAGLGRGGLSCHLG